MTSRTAARPDAASHHRPLGGRRPRRVRISRVAVAAALAAGLALGACTDDAPRPAASGSGTSGSSPGSTATPSPTTPRGIVGAPPALAALVTKVYGGGSLAGAASPTAAAALAKRTPSAGTVDGRAAVGTWRGTPVAVVTVGDDVTLAVGPTWRVVGGWWPSLKVPTPSVGKGPRWVLGIGSDARPGQDLTRTRADTLQVVGVDGRGGGGVMGMARDLWVPLATGGSGKINSAMALGGVDAQLRTVRSVTGLPIEGYVVIGFTGFERLVDEQGGIPIVVPQTVNAAHAGIVIKAGAQTLTGRQALAYARERKTLPDGDFGRSRHQGQIILAAAVRAKVLGPIAIPRALTSLDKVAKSNLTAEQALTFAGSLYAVNPLKVGRGVAKGAFGWAGSQSIVVLGREARSLFASFRDGSLG